MFLPFSAPAQFEIQKKEADPNKIKTMLDSFDCSSIGFQFPWKLQKLHSQPFLVFTKV